MLLYGSGPIHMNVVGPISTPLTWGGLALGVVQTHKISVAQNRATR